MKRYNYYIVWMGDGKTGTMTHKRPDKILTIDAITEIAKIIKSMNRLITMPIILNFILLGEEEEEGGSP